MSFEEKQQQLVDDLGLIDDPHERFGYIIDRAKSNPPLDDDFKKEIFEIEGCLSRLWLVPSFDGDHCQFKSDADSAITKGVSALLCDLYSDCTPDEIIAHPPAFLGQVGITQHLSHNRRNGLTNLVRKIMDYATFCKNNPDSHQPQSS